MELRSITGVGSENKDFAFLMSIRDALPIRSQPKGSQILVNPMLRYGISELKPDIDQKLRMEKVFDLTYRLVREMAPKQRILIRRRCFGPHFFSNWALAMKCSKKWQVAQLTHT